MLRINLQMFAGEEAAAAPETAETDTGSAEAAQGTESVNQTAPVNPLAQVQYGIRPRTAPVQNQQAPTQQAVQQQEKPAEETFEQLIKGRYKADYDQRVQQAIQQRFKNVDADRKRMDAMQPIMQAMAVKYGLQADDIDGIANAIRNDNAMYADEAARQGLPVETYKQMQQLKYENERFRAQQAEAAEDRAMREHFNRVAQQAAEFQKMVPGFDIRTEMQNPRFARMVGPDGGVSVQDAYFAIHREEMQQMAAQQAAQQAARGIASRVAAGQQRPTENGIGSAGGTQAKADVSSWTPEDFKEVARRVKAGQKIYL